MKKAMLIVVTLALVLASPIAVMAQEAGAEESESGPPSSGIGFGVESIQYQGETWTRVHAFPVFPLWKFRFAFDVELFLNPDGELSQRGWNFASTDATLDTLSRKIYYVGFNDKRAVTDGEAIFYTRVGALDGVTLGNGIIVNNYRNTLDYPLEKKIGVEFALGNLTPLNFGVEGVVPDVTDVSRGGGVMAARASFTPLGFTGIPLLNKLEIGGTVATDINQYSGLKDSDDDGYPDAVDRFPFDPDKAKDTDGDGVADSEDVDLDGDQKPEFGLTQDELDDLTGLPPEVVVDDDGFPQEDLFSLEGASNSFTMVGGDLRMPILPFLDLYAQGAMSMDMDEEGETTEATGWGFAGPGLFLDFLPILSFDLAYRQTEGAFQFGYFGENYDNQRAVVIDDGADARVKDDTLSDQSLAGVFGALNVNLFIIDVYGSYEYLAPLSGGDNAMSVEVRAGLNQERVAAIPMVSQYLGGFEAYYIHQGAQELSDFLEPDSTVLMGAQLQIKLGESTFLNYDFTRSFDDDGDYTDTMTIGTETSF